jgi:mono/diheme cytochrome c family protein
MVALRFGLTLLAAMIGADERVPADDQGSGAASASASASGPGLQTSATGPVAGGQAPPPPPAATGTSGLSSAQVKAVSVKPDQAAALPAAVVLVYRTSCLKCHDGDGTGEAGRAAFPTIPDFTERRWQALRSETELSRSILEGKGRSMPRMKDKLGAVDVKQMVAFVRGFQGGKQVVDDQPEEPSPPEKPRAAAMTTGSAPRAAEPRPSTANANGSSNHQASQLFGKLCVLCHGPDGKGSGVRNTMPAIPDFTRRGWHERRADPQLVQSILDGRGTGMPAFGAKISREQVRELVAFIRSFDPSRRQASGAAPADFEARFRELKEEFDALSRQRAGGTSPPQKPASKAAPPPSPARPQPRRIRD